MTSQTAISVALATLTHALKGSEETLALGGKFAEAERINRVAGLREAIEMVKGVAAMSERLRAAEELIDAIGLADKLWVHRLELLAELIKLG